MSIDNLFNFSEFENALAKSNLRISHPNSVPEPEPNTPNKDPRSPRLFPHPIPTQSQSQSQSHFHLLNENQSFKPTKLVLTSSTESSKPAKTSSNLILSSPTQASSSSWLYSSQCGNKYWEYDVYQSARLESLYARYISGQDVDDDAILSINSIEYEIDFDRMLQIAQTKRPIRRVSSQELDTLYKRKMIKGIAGVHKKR
jgi:hypothetical protein